MYSISSSTGCGEDERGCGLVKRRQLDNILARLAEAPSVVSANRICLGYIGAVFALCAALAHAEQTSTTTGPGSQVISPTVEITVFTEGRADGADELELLVLWRGAAGWFLRPGSATAGRTTSAGRSHLTIQRGDLQLTLEYDRTNRVVSIQGKPVTLARDNVVFADDVDLRDGPRVTGTMHVPRAMPGSAGQIGLVLKQSREIMSFLRCDAALPDVPERAWLAGLCLQNIGIAR